MNNDINNKFKRIEASCKGERFLSVEISGGDGRDLERSLALLETECGSFKEELPCDAVVINRFFLSDISNQFHVVRRYVKSLFPGGHSILIGQPPANGSKISMLSYVMRGEVVREDDDHLIVSHGEYRSIFARLPAALGTVDRSDRGLFEQLESLMVEQGITIEAELMRTWIYLRDIDNNYAAMVESRKEMFNRNRLTADNHFIASTGIGAMTYPVNELVQLDAMAISGIQQGQIEYMEALDNMCPTSDYGVTFERGTKMNFGDRSHCHISGTASIDKQGEILHLGDVEAQTHRAIENIRVLMRSSDQALSDMRSIIIYLRDLTDYPVVNRVVNSYADLEATAKVFVKGEVCRPEWLVEIEGVAISEQGDEAYPPFLTA